MFLNHIQNIFQNIQKYVWIENKISVNIQNIFYQQI